ncbi:MAG: CoA transferase, partial [Stellaceae bacterium]
MPGPLSGYRIVDLTSNVSGPLGTMILADQGADVIKVEPPDGGDHTRAAANRRAGFSASFLNNNRNKRSVVLNLKQPGAVQALLRLAAGADVFIQNFRPGVAERLGVGESAVRAVAPSIVYVSISG